MTTTKRVDNHKDLQKNLMFDFISEYFCKTENINNAVYNTLGYLIKDKFKISYPKAVEVIDLWLKEFTYHTIMIKNNVSFRGYAESYYNKIKERKTDLNYQFFLRLIDWINQVPADNKLETAKRIFVYEFLSEKAVVNE